MYLIDTNIFGFLNRKNPKVIAKFSSVDHSLIYIPSIVWAEICFGLLLMDNSNPKLPKLKAYYSNINQTSYFLDFNKNTAEIFATLKSSSRQSGNNIEDFDLMIASIAIENNLVLVTNNTKHFVNIAGLKAEDWSKG
jgi:tRNA(fMet)-specific endonuclease VapC